MSPPGAASSAAPAAAAVDYRHVAQQILGEHRFQPPPLPRPLHGVLDALGRALGPLFSALADGFHAVARILPGGDAALWALIAAALVAIAAFASARATDRALLAVDRSGPLRTDGGAAPSAKSLEAAAAAAEGERRYEQAIRLQFQAGLLRLDELGALRYSPSLANAAVSRRLRSPIFDALARRFEEVAYGGRPAAAADVVGAREGWRQMLDLARRR